MSPLTSSYVQGVSNVPLLGDTIGVHFDRIAARFSDCDAVVVRHEQIRWTYADLKREVDSVAVGLLALGLQPGDRVGLWSPNNSSWVVAQFATAKAGLILVNINPAYRLMELEYALNAVGCKALITAERFKSSDYIAMIRDLAPESATSRPGELQAKRLPALRTLIRIGNSDVPGFLQFEELAGMAGDAHRRRLEELAGVLQFDDPINIQYTSGTTGAPKGATLTHHSILNNGMLVARALRYTEQDRVCIPIPLYHCFGMVIGCLGCMTAGSAMIFPAESFDAKSTLAAIQHERCTSIYGVPTMFVAMMAETDFDTYDLRSLRTGIMGGSPCPVEVMRQTISRMGVEQITIAYGMTETSPVITHTAVDDSLERRVDTVGRAFPHTEVKIVDASNRIVPLGVSGELCARGYLVMHGYWNDPSRTQEAIDAGGWMHTGDLAAMREDGYCSIVGRIKDVVIRGGDNIYPREVEEFLYKHPKIEAVQVFGIPCDKYGEELCAWIKLRAGQVATVDEIRSFCKDQIAHYKVPRHVRFVTEFPMTVTGKIQKFVMRERMMDELGLRLASG